MITDKIFLPSPLKHGATIGIVAPSGRIHDVEYFEKGVGILHEMGFQTKFPRELWPGCDYFADSDSESNRDVHNNSDCSYQGCDNKHHNSTYQLHQQQWM